MLAPTLLPGDVVVMDHLQFHKVAGVADAVCRGGGISAAVQPPDLNPIEQAFAKLKAELRRRAEWVEDRLWAALKSRSTDSSPSGDSRSALTP